MRGSYRSIRVVCPNFGHPALTSRVIYKKKIFASEKQLCNIWSMNCQFKICSAFEWRFIIFVAYPTAYDYAKCVKLERRRARPLRKKDFFLIYLYIIAQKLWRYFFCQNPFPAILKALVVGPLKKVFCLWLPEVRAGWRSQSTPSFFFRSL